MNERSEDSSVSYNTPDFAIRVSADLSRLSEALPARVGAPAPEFEAVRLDGGRFRLADVRGRRHVVLMMGAITSPMTAIAIPGMNRLYEEFGGRDVEFFLVYVKESHPAENYRHHTSMEQKMAYARDLLRLEKPAFPILVDSLDGAIHRSYGQRPAALFVVHKDGRLMFRSTIAQPSQLEHFLGEVMDWDRLEREQPERVSHVSYTETIVEHEVDEGEHYRVYARAGPKAFEDYWKFNPAHRNKWPRATGVGG
jgi:alkyl hydroperoxide reductase subunit AhpC